MSLISAINGVCDLVSLSRFERICGIDDENAQTMLELAEEAGSDIARRGDWPAMVREIDIASSPFPLPDDFHRPVPGGAVQLQSGVFARPVAGMGEWAALSVGSAQPYFTVIGRSLHIAPTGPARLRYLSDTFVLTDADLRQNRFLNDNDTTLFPERLLVKAIVWRWRRKNGLAFDQHLSEFETDLAAEIRAARGLA